MSGLFVFVAACSEPPTAPGPPTIPRPPTTLLPPTPGPPAAPSEPQPQPSVMTTFTVTNGWTGEAVPGAVLSVNGTEAETDGAGQVQLLKTGNCLKVEVTASGFLERRTCSASVITLWPVADEEEREATRNAAFRNDRLGPFGSGVEVSLAEDLQARRDVLQTWKLAADEIQRLTLNRVHFSFIDGFFPEYPDWGFIIAAAGAPPDCDARFSPPWPIETGGFCVERVPEHWFVERINVLPGRLTDGSIALRALLTNLTAMKPHAMPGLMNSNRPDRELSTFERKTLHMIGLRKGVDVVWPDLEP